MPLCSYGFPVRADVILPVFNSLEVSAKKLSAHHLLIVCEW